MQSIIMAWGAGLQVAAAVAHCCCPAHAEGLAAPAPAAPALALRDG
eukprot:COSAG01_NODE_53576_length_338_cov_0.790795_1_plen_45_part_10